MHRFFIGFNLAVILGGTVMHCRLDKMEKRAVANGCAIRVLDSASGEVKTVWKDGKP